MQSSLCLVLVMLSITHQVIMSLPILWRTTICLYVPITVRWKDSPHVCIAVWTYWSGDCAYNLFSSSSSSYFWGEWVISYHVSRKHKLICNWQAGYLQSSADNGRTVGKSILNSTLRYLEKHSLHFLFIFCFATSCPSHCFSECHNVMSELVLSHPLAWE